jgi:isopentenyldiphosphate isomerase
MDPKAISDSYEVLTESGAPTGEILDRKTVHAKELWHGVANIWIVNSKGEILLQLRAPEVELCPNVWDVALGTHLRAHETPTDAAQRGLRTGLGIEVAPEDLKHLFNIQCANPMANKTIHKVFGHVFLLQRDIDVTALKVDPQKITQLVWKPIALLMAEVGSTETAKQYFPRTSNYYPKLFEALQTMM